jgi:hypothetical protein
MSRAGELLLALAGTFPCSRCSSRFCRSASIFSVSGAGAGSASGYFAVAESVSTAAGTVVSPAVSFSASSPRTMFRGNGPREHSRASSSGHAIRIKGVSPHRRVCVSCQQSRTIVTALRTARTGLHVSLPVHPRDVRRGRQERSADGSSLRSPWSALPAGRTGPVGCRCCGLRT